MVRGYGGYNTRWALFLLHYIFPLMVCKLNDKIKGEVFTFPSQLPPMDLRSTVINMTLLWLMRFRSLLPWLLWFELHQKISCWSGKNRLSFVSKRCSALSWTRFIYWVEKRSKN